jgi:Glyoxalase-like domain
MAAVALQVTVDCSDPRQMAAFWSKALGYLIEFDDPANAWGAVADPGAKGPRLVFQRVPEPKAAKNRTHLDLQVGQPKLADELTRLTSLGARVLRNLAFDPGADALQDATSMSDVAPVRWRRFILADPEGNEFCLQ